MSIEPALYCNVCQAIVRETLQILRHRTSESEVVSALENICYKGMIVSRFPPSDMTRGCLAFLDGWQEVLEKALMKRKENKSVEEEICFKKSKACEEVDQKQKKTPTSESVIPPKNIKIMSSEEAAGEKKTKMNPNAEKIEL